jgi:predicted alpha/beta superfamily hydrolase
VVRLVLGLPLLALLVAFPVRAAPWQLDNSEVRSITASNGASYSLMVAWPEGECPPRGWPVLWVLDGEDNFAIAVLTAERLAEAGTRTGIGAGVVVGVDSGPLAQRVFDYTPATPQQVVAPGMPAAGLKTGGADTFLDVLENELRPLVVGRCEVDPERQTLAGHSFGGLLALHALASDRSFSAYAAVSPSLWLGNGPLVAEEGGDGRLLLASGTDEPNLAKGETPQALARRRRGAGRKVEYLSLGGHGHGTTMLAAMGAVIEIAFGRGQ